MKNFLVMMAVVMFASNIAQAEICVDKIQAIETQLSVAKTSGNSNRVSGLETALKKAKANCTDEKLQEKKAEKIADKKADVEKAQRKLDKSIADGKSDKKIEKKRKKLEEQKQELQDALAK